MIFKQYQQVLDELKNQTRRPVRVGDLAIIRNALGRLQATSDPSSWEGEIVEVWHNGRAKWRVGETYAVQPGRGKKAVSRIRILKIRRERLWDISWEDILAEGYPIRKPGDWPGRRWWFTGIWQSLYRHPYRWEDNPEVWVLEFELAKGGEKDV